MNISNVKLEPKQKVTNIALINETRELIKKHNELWKKFIEMRARSGKQNTAN